MFAALESHLHPGIVYAIMLTANIIISWTLNLLELNTWTWIFVLIQQISSLPTQAHWIQPDII